MCMPSSVPVSLREWCPEGGLGGPTEIQGQCFGPALSPAPSPIPGISWEERGTGDVWDSLPASTSVRLYPQGSGTLREASDGQWGVFGSCASTPLPGGLAVLGFPPRDCELCGAREPGLLRSPRAPAWARGSGGSGVFWRPGCFILPGLRAPLRPPPPISLGMGMGEGTAHPPPILRSPREGGPGEAAGGPC